MKQRISINNGTWFSLTLAAIAMLLLAVACSNPSAKEQAVVPTTEAPPSTEAPAPSTASTEESSIPIVPIEVNDDGFKVAEVVPGGIVQINIINTGSESAAPSLVRIKEGHTRQELSTLMDASNENPADFSSLAQVFDVANAIYGNENLGPGATATFYADLRTGDFALQDDSHQDRGLTYFMAHEIIGKTEPVTAMHIDMVDFTYAMPDVAPSTGLWEFTNSGDQWHMAMLIPHNPDMTPEQLLSALSDENPSITIVDGGILPISPGERVWVEMDLQPGEYDMVCPLPDLAAMVAGGEPMPHLLHGMQHVFTVND